jgi:hypothetical protein
MALGEILFNFCTEKLDVIDSPSRFSDLLVAILLQFRLSIEMIRLVLAHFPIVNSHYSFKYIYPSILVQLRQIPDAFPLLLFSIIRLFCLNIPVINNCKILS